jgi:hypothetical protein
LQHFYQLFKASSKSLAMPPPLSSPAASSILREIQQHPSYKTFQQPQKTLSTTPNAAFTLENIPSEMQLAIMKKLPDLESLRSLSLISPQFNRLRIEHQVTVLATVPNSEIDASVFEQAYWTMRAAQQGFDSSNHRSKLRDFMAAFSDSDSDPPEAKHVPLAELIKISSLHSHVTTLVKDFCAYALSGPLAPSPACSKPSAISSMEFNRIALAFYRFELYCNLYKDHLVVEDGTLQASDKLQMKLESFKLFDSWNAWESEGVACMRDYFCARLTDAFANIQRAASAAPLRVYSFPPRLARLFGENVISFSSHSLIPSWYDDTAPCGASFSHQGRDTDHLKEMFMGRGLTFLCNFLTAGSSYEQYQLFQSITHDLATSDTRDYFITYALRAIPLAMRDGGDMVEAFCHNDKQRFEGDIDAAAPPFAWVWANGATCEPFYAQKRMEYLRSLGYVMWDQERLLQVLLFRKLHLRPAQAYDQAPSRKTAEDDHQSHCSRPAVVFIPQNICSNPVPYSTFHPPPAVGGSSDVECRDDSSDGQADELDGTPQIQPVESSSHSTLDSTLDATMSEESMANTTSAKSASSEETTLVFHTPLNNPQLPVVEGNDDIVGPIDDSTVDEAQAHEIETGLDANEEPVAEMKRGGSYSGSASIVPSTLRTQPIEQTEFAQDGLTELGDAPPHAPAIESISVDEATPEVLPMKHSFNPVVPEEATAYTESVSNVDDVTNIPSQGDATNEAAAEPEYIAAAPRARRMARAISTKAKMLKAQQQALQQQVEHKAESAISNSTTIEGPIQIRCTMPGSTVVEVRAPSPPLSECSSTSSDSINWITSPPSSVKSKEPCPSADVATNCTSTPPRQPTPPTDTEEEAEHETKPATKPSVTSTHPAFHNISPSEIAAWIEQSKCRDFSPSSSESANASNIPTKQQRKKANRKARKAMEELVMQQAREAEAGRVRVEEAKKEHQKVKREKKKLEKKEVGAGAGHVPGAEGKKGLIENEGAKKKKIGKGKNGRKVGYLLG